MGFGESIFFAGSTNRMVSWSHLPEREGKRGKKKAGSTAESGKTENGEKRRKLTKIEHFKGSRKALSLRLGIGFKGTESGKRKKGVGKGLTIRELELGIPIRTEGRELPMDPFKAFKAGQAAVDDDEAGGEVLDHVEVRQVLLVKRLWELPPDQLVFFVVCWQGLIFLREVGGVVFQVVSDPFFESFGKGDCALKEEGRREEGKGKPWEGKKDQGRKGERIPFLCSCLPSCLLGLLPAFCFSSWPFFLLLSLFFPFFLHSYL